MFETDATVETTDDSIRVTTQQANDHGTQLLVALEDAGITVTSFDIEEATLNDVFLAIAEETGDGLETETA